MSMKKRNWTPIKEMLFAYLAINKMLYWINIIPAASDFGGVTHVILERLIQRDIVLILVIVFIYFFEEKVILKQNRWNGFLGQIMLAVGGYGMFSIVMVTYLWVLNLILSTPVNMGTILTSPFMLEQTIIFFIIMAVLIVKEHFKKKEASNYALGIQSTNIKLEVLNTLLEDGALNQEEFERQKVKLLDM